MADSNLPHIGDEAQVRSADLPTMVLVPEIPTDEQWGGLARDIVMWMDCYPNSLTPRTLLKHLELVGADAPQWLLDEPEMQHTDHTISKGTRATLIYRAMVCAALSKAKEA